MKKRKLAKYEMQLLVDDNMDLSLMLKGRHSLRSCNSNESPLYTLKQYDSLSHLVPSHGANLWHVLVGMLYMFC